MIECCAVLVEPPKMSSLSSCNTKTRISLKRKVVFQKGKRHSSLLRKAFKINSNYFLLHRHFNHGMMFEYLADIFVALSPIDCFATDANKHGKQRAPLGLIAW